MTATVIVVAFGTDRVDLGWVPASSPIVIVHNDELLDRGPVRADARHIDAGGNVGFGAAVNLALAEVDTERVILCNPDTRLHQGHYDALTTARADELVTIPLVEPSGAPNSVVNEYWGPLSFLATAWRLGRFAPRGGVLRRVLTPLLGRWGRVHAQSLRPEGGVWSLAERWASGAVLSIPTDALRTVGGFDDDYFLYYEDTDLQQRLARSRPDLRLRLAAIEPALHVVGASGDAVSDGSVDVAALRRSAARTYAGRQPGVAWRVVGALVGGSREVVA